MPRAAVVAFFGCSFRDRGPPKLKHAITARRCSIEPLVEHLQKFRCLVERAVVIKLVRLALLNFLDL